MPSGVVKWFDPDQGLGAIAQDGDRLDAVAHSSAVHGDAERVLVAGGRVCLDVTQDAAGVRADNIHPPTRLCCPPTEALAGEPPARPQDGQLARSFLLVAAPDGGSAVDAVLLVVSELYTNAVLHAGRVTGFRLETVTVAVHDASPLPPRSLPLEANRPGGFGWHLVQELSVDVQVQVHSAGKTVIAVVPCPTEVRPRG